MTAVQGLQHPVLAVALLIAFFDGPAEILARPRADTVLLDVRPTQDEGPEGRHLPFAQSRRPPGMWPIVQPLDALRVEPVNPA